MSRRALRALGLLGLSLLVGTAAEAQQTPAVLFFESREVLVNVQDYGPNDREAFSLAVTVNVGAVVEPDPSFVESREFVVNQGTDAPPSPVSGIAAFSSDESSIIVDWAGYDEAAQLDLLEYQVYVSASPAFDPATGLPADGTLLASVFAGTFMVELQIGDVIAGLSDPAADPIWIFVVPVDYSGNVPLTPELILFTRYRFIEGREVLLNVGAVSEPDTASLVSRALVVNQGTAAPPEAVDAELIVFEDESGLTLGWDDYDEFGQFDVARYRLYLGPAASSSLLESHELLFDLNGDGVIDENDVLTFGVSEISFTIAELESLLGQSIPFGTDLYFFVVAEDYSGNASQQGPPIIFTRFPRLESRELLVNIGAVDGSALGEARRVQSRETVLVIANAAAPERVTTLTVTDLATVPGEDENKLLLDWSGYEAPGDLRGFRIIQSCYAFATVTSPPPNGADCLIEALEFSEDFLGQVDGGSELLPKTFRQIQVDKVPAGELQWLAVVPVDYLGNFDPVVNVEPGFSEGTIFFTDNFVSEPASPSETFTRTVVLDTSDDFDTDFTVSSGASWLTVLRPTGYTGDPDLGSLVELQVDTSTLMANSTASTTVVVTAPGLTGDLLTFEVVVDDAMAPTERFRFQPDTAYFARRANSAPFGFSRDLVRSNPVFPASFTIGPLTPPIDNVVPSSGSVTTSTQINFTHDISTLFGAMNLEEGALGSVRSLVTATSVGLEDAELAVDTRVTCDSVSNLACALNSSDEIELTWTNPELFDSIEVRRGGETLVLPGDATSFAEPQSQGYFTYFVRPICLGQQTTGRVERCSIFSSSCEPVSNYNAVYDPTLDEIQFSWENGEPSYRSVTLRGPAFVSRPEAGAESVSAIAPRSGTREYSLFYRCQFGGGGRETVSVRVCRPVSQLTCVDFRATGSIVLSWLPDGDYDSIEIRRDGLSLATISGGASQFVDGGAPAGALDYEVVGFCGTEEFIASCSVDFTPCVPPTDFTCNAAPGGQVTLSWTAPQVYMDGIVVRRGGLDIATLAGTDTQFVDLPGEGVFDYEVVFQCAPGTSQTLSCIVDNAQALFRRGDVNDDGGLNIGDVIRTLNFLFSGAAPLECAEAADSDDDGDLDLADPLLTLGFLFGNGGPLAPPGFACGFVPDDGDGLDCAIYTSCP